MNDMVDVGMIRQIKERAREVISMTERHNGEKISESVLLRADARVRELLMQKLPMRSALSMALREIFPHRQKPGSKTRPAYEFALGKMLEFPDLSPRKVEETAASDGWPLSWEHPKSDFIYDPVPEPD
jgi:hypothetical protein